MLAFHQWPPPSPLAWPLLVLLLPVLAERDHRVAHGRRSLRGSLRRLLLTGSCLPPAWSFKPLDRVDASAMGVFGVVSALVALVSHARHHATVAQARAAELSSAVVLERRRRRTLADVTARRLRPAVRKSVCRDAASLAASALDCDHALVLELGNEGAPFTVVAAAGWNAGRASTG